MARKTVIELLDDIDGTPAEGTVTFALDGVEYQIDLNSTHAAQLGAALAPFTEKARRLAKPGNGPTAKASPGGDRERSARIRAWAEQHGIPVNDRGRIPTQIIEAFEANDPSLAKTSAQQTVPQVTFRAVSNP